MTRPLVPKINRIRGVVFDTAVDSMNPCDAMSVAYNPDACPTNQGNPFASNYDALGFYGDITSSYGQPETVSSYDYYGDALPGGS